METYSITNPQGATLRIASNTGAGQIRKAEAGTKVSAVGIIKTNAGRDRWLLLTDIDPETREPWRYEGKEVSVYVALYVNGTTYAKKVESETVPGNSNEWNAALTAAAQATALTLESLRK